MGLNFFTYSFHFNTVSFEELRGYLAEYHVRRLEIYRKVISRNGGNGVGGLDKIEFNQDEERALDEIITGALKKIRPSVFRTIKALKAHLKEEVDSDNSIIGLV